MPKAFEATHHYGTGRWSWPPAPARYNAGSKITIGHLTGAFNGTTHQYETVRGNWPRAAMHMLKVFGLRHLYGRKRLTTSMELLEGTSCGHTNAEGIFVFVLRTDYCTGGAVLDFRKEFEHFQTALKIF